MNAELKQIQETLKTIGLYTGAIDGLIGNKTYSAFIKLKEYEGSKQPLREIHSYIPSKAGILVKGTSPHLDYAQFYPDL